jgi:hypothetical protein
VLIPFSPPHYLISNQDEDPSQAKEVLSLLFASVAVLVLAVALCLYFVSGPSWRQLSSGARVRVFTVTVGTKHRVDFPARSWAAHYRELFSRRFSARSWPQLISRPHGWGSAISSKPSTVIWFQSDRFVRWEATLITADRQRYQTQGANGPSTNGYACTSMQFPVVPSEKTLNLEVTFDGELDRFEIRNPSYPRSD